MIEIAFEGLPEDEAITSIIKASIEAVLAQQKVVGGGEVSILLTSDHMLRTLNREHRGEDKATDVLSFGNEGSNQEGDLRYLGDIAISRERAKVQAANSGHSEEAELQLLCVHGMLHLLGYDHGKAAEKQVMWAEQNAILDILGVVMDREQIGT